MKNKEYLVAMDTTYRKISSASDIFKEKRGSCDTTRFYSNEA